MDGMKKRVALLLACMLLALPLASCGMAELELGGLVGELMQELQSGEIENEIIDEYVSDRVDIDEVVSEPGWIDQPIPTLPLPEAIVLGSDILVYETIYTTAFDQDSCVAQGTYAAEQAFKDKYGYAIVHQKFSSNTIASRVKAKNAAGEDAPILCYLQLSDTFAAYTQGQYQSNRTVQLYDHPCWDYALNEDLQVGERQYAFAGALTPMTSLKTYCVVFNEELSREMDLDPYALYRSGEWTLESFTQMCKNASDGPNGNLRVAHVCSTGDYNIDDQFFYSCGTDLFENVNVILSGNAYDIDFDALPRGHQGVASTNAFGTFSGIYEKGTLFLHTTLAEYAGLYMDTEPYNKQSDFSAGLLPVPKYDNNASYTACVDPETVSVLTVPKCFESYCSETVNAYAMLSWEAIEPEMLAWMHKVTPNETAYGVSMYLMESVSVDMVSILLRDGYNAELNPFKYQAFIANNEDEVYALLIKLQRELGMDGK